VADAVPALSPVRRRALLALMLASGFAGLGYQIVWTQQTALWLGHEAAAVLAVVTAFFGGLALGALTLGRHIERGTQPARWYAGCEILIAAWSLVLALTMGPVSESLLRLTGAQPAPLWQGAVAFIGCFLLLLPATLAMGATLPAMARVLAGMAERGTSLAALYAGNTLGAMVGVLATAFWLIPAVGLARTAAVCALLNLLCAGVVLALVPAGRSPPRVDARTASPYRHLLWLAATGWLGIGYEVLVVRVLSQVTENTVYTFAILLAIYLLGTALGAAAYARWAPGAARADRMAGNTSHDPVRDRLLAGAAWACLAGVGSLFFAEITHDWPAAMPAAADSTSLGWALAGEALPALLAFALPTLAMGALFSHMATRARAAGVGFATALGANTLGAAAAPLLFGWWLVPALGAKAALLLLPAAYLLLVSPRGWWRPAVLVALAGTVAVAWWAPPLAFITVPEGGKVLSYQEGTRAAVSVVEDAEGVARLRINNRQQEGSSATVFADARQALLPLLLHPAPQRVLFLGLGTGVTASAAAADKSLQVDAAELLPEVIAASALFRRDGATAQATLLVADARRFIKAAGRGYDLIVSDNFHPARSGSGTLYTVEHFAAVRARLQPGGVFCQWLPLHQIDLATLRSVVQSFMAVYPDGAAVLATNSLQTPVLGLLARPDAPRFGLQAVRQRLSNSSLPQRLADYGLADEFAVLGSFVAGPQALKQFAGDAPLNTDDRPIVAYRAPRITYVPDSLPADRLQALLRELHTQPAELVDAGADAHGLPRLAAYWAARESYIAAGRQVRPGGDVRQMLAQVQAPLLAVLRISPDFRPALEPLQRMAAQLAASDPAAARALMQALAEIQAQGAQTGQSER